MDRNREGRRASVVGSNGFNRRRHRTNSVRDSPGGDGGPERVEKDRESRSKRRRADIAGDDASRESADEEEDGEIAAVRFSSSHHHSGGHGSGFSNFNHRLQHRQTFPPSASSSAVRAPAVWKPGGETIAAAVPRKARSASTKRLHDWVSISGNGDQNPSQPSSSPARPGPAPASPSSSTKKKLPPKPTSSSNADELEIEIAEVLFGLMNQPSCNSSPLSAMAPKRKKPRQVPDFGSQETTIQTPKTEISDSAAAEELKESRDLISNAKEEDMGSSKEHEYPTNLIVSEVEDQKEVKLEINLMEIKSDTEVVVSKANEDKKDNGESDNSHSPNVETDKSKSEPNISKNLDLEKPEQDISSNENKPQLLEIKHQKSSKEEQPLTEKPGQSKSSFTSAVPVGGWLPPMGYMAPLQGVGVLPLKPLFSQPRPKRCATHCHIARNIHWLKQVEKMNAAQRKQHNILMPPQVAAAACPTAAGKSPTAAPSSTSSSAPMSFNYPNMSPNEAQYLAILQNNAYPFPVSTVGPPPLFYPSQIIQKAHSNQYTKSGGKDDNNPSVNIYGQNFHTQNSTLLTTSNVLAGSNSSNRNEKRSGSQPHQQQKGTKIGVESLPPHTFAISFGPGTDAASVVQSHAMFQSRISEEGKPGNSANLDSSSVKVDAHTALIQANSNAGSGAMNSVQNAQVHAKFQQQKMLRQLKHQQQQMAAVNGINRTNKHHGTSNGSIYSEHLNSSSMIGGKFPNTMSPVFTQNIVQRSNSPTSSPRTLVSSSSQTLHKNLPQQNSRNQPQMHTQISFGGNQKQPKTPSQGQGPPPTTSSSSKSTSGNLRTNSSFTTSNSKTAALHSTPFTAQLPKNSPSVLGNSKPQMQSQQKKLQQLQFFSSPYSHSHRLSISGPSQHQRLPPGVSTNDPAAAIAAATSNAKGQSGVMMVQASPLTLPPAGFSYVHSVPVKPVEQKQTPGNDSLNQRHSEKK